MAEVILQWHRFAVGDKRQITERIEVDYHSGLGRFGIEAVTEDGQIIIVYLSMIEACGLSAALRSEIGAASDAIEGRARRGVKCGNAVPRKRYTTGRR